MLATIDTGSQPLDGTVADGIVWIPDRTTGELFAIDATTDTIVATVELGPGIAVAEVVGGEIWVLDFDGTDVVRVDPAVVLSTTP